MQLPGSAARGPVPGNSYHSFCLDCRRVIYNLNKYGPVTPYTYNRSFCVCNGKQTGEVALKVTVYDLEDVLKPEEARKERERQIEEAKKFATTRDTRTSK